MPALSDNATFTKFEPREQLHDQRQAKPDSLDQEHVPFAF